MDREKEIRLAKASYSWLGISPILTIGTLFLIVSMGIGDSICDSGAITCYYNTDTYISFAIGILASALWHLTLLQYVNNKDSEFVRSHGQRALTQAGIRTGVAMFGVALDWFANADGGIACIAIIILLVIWAVNVSQSKHWVKSDNPPVTESMKTALNTPIVRTQPTKEILDQILEELNSEDDVIVLVAIDKLEHLAESNDVILKKLEELADEDDNMDIRMDARVTFNRLRTVSQPIQATRMEGTMSESDTRKPEEILNELYQNLQSSDDVVVIQAIASLKTLNYSSEVIRRRLEWLAVKSKNKDIRSDALSALDSAASRAVQKRFNANRLDRGIRHTLLQEINEWEKGSLLDKQNADVIRRRYDFDITPAPTTQAAPPPQPVAAPAQAAAATPQAQTPAPVPPAQPQVPPEPRPSLLQTLTSEASIKIYLYLGAFFVIAAAAILGAVVPGLRLPILIISTIIFGGLAVVIKKRLPQPSFALFIVFSFLLPITANSLEESLRETLNLTADFTDAYWAIVFIFMAIIWIGSTWLYESRFFSLTAFGSLILASFRLGGLFEADLPIYTLLMGFTALAGLAGAWLAKKWKDDKFALPLFLATQLLQVINLAISFGAFNVENFGQPSYGNLLHLVTFTAWVLGTIFYIFSDELYPFFAFPWLTAATFIPMPWFITAAFDLESLGAAIVFFVWGAILAIVSEPALRFERIKKYALPTLLACMPSLALAVFIGFIHETWLGMTLALGTAILFTGLHILQTRWWLWALALLNAIITYFAFFELEFIQKLDIFFSYELVGVTILFLLPDLFLKKDWNHSPQWRLPLRMPGAAFLFITSITLLTQSQSGHVAVGFITFTLFCTAYALSYRNSYIGYLSAVYLPLAVVYALDAFNLDAWLPALSALAVLYYVVGFAIRRNETWAVMLRNSGMALGVILSVTALIAEKESGGWYTLLMGSLFIAEMRVRQNGWFEIGAPILFTSGAFLILRDFNVNQSHFHLLVYSLIWIFTDLLNHLTFPHSRPTNTIIRGIGGVMAVLNMITIPINAIALDATICYGTYTLAFVLCAFVYRKAWLGYIPAATLPLTIFFALNHFNADAWLPALTGLAVLYFIAGLAFRAKENWSLMLRNSALALGSIVSIAALITLKETGGWYAFAAGLLFIAEMSLRKNGWLEPGAPILFTLGIFLILRDFNIERIPYHLLAYSLVWLLADLLAHLAYPNPRPLKMAIRFIGGFIALVNYGFLFLESDSLVSTVGFGVYALLFLAVSLVYRQPNLLYTFTVTLPLFAIFLFRTFGVTQWIHPVIVVAMLYYAAGTILRAINRAQGWDQSLLYSGLGVGVIVSIAAPILGGLDASIPVAIAATLWAVEAYAKKSAWLAFPANGLYLLAYFIILFELNVDEPQFFSVGTALFGLIQHYLLTRTESRSGTFVMGMFSQFVLLGTTYIEMVNKNDLNYFFLLFVQSLIILVYGIVIRSRSLTFFPIGFVALGVVTVVYSALKDIGTIFVIGCTGIILLMLGIAAVLLRERIAKLGEKLSDWQA